MDRHGNLALKERTETLSTKIRKVKPVAAGRLIYKKPVSSIKPSDYERNQQIDAAYEYLNGKYIAGSSKADIAVKYGLMGFALGIVVASTTIYLIWRFL